MANTLLSCFSLMIHTTHHELALKHVVKYLSDIPSDVGKGKKAPRKQTNFLINPLLSDLLVVK